MQAFDYIFNIGGDFQAKVDNMNRAVGEFSGKMENAQGWVLSFAQKLATFDLACGYVERLAGTLEGLSTSGVALDSQMHDLSAVAGAQRNRGLRPTERKNLWHGRRRGRGGL